jgi:protein transport protein SEC24
VVFPVQTVCTIIIQFSLAVAARYTGGSVHYYPGFNAVRSEDAFKFASELNHFLARPMGMEAVLRVRCSKGIRADAFHGNFFVRSSDLLALPSVSPDNSYAFQMTMEENLPAGMAVCQTALLYTTHFGERRIRVLTTAYPVSQDLPEIYRNVDSMAMVNLLSKMAIERGLNAKLEDAREALINKCVDILGCFKQTVSSSASMPQLIASENLLPLSLALLATIKHVSCFLFFF